MNKADLEKLRQIAIIRKVFGYILSTNLASNKPLRLVFETQIGNVSSLVHASPLLIDLCHDLGLGLKDLEDVIIILTKEKVFFTLNETSGDHHDSSQNGTDSSPSSSLSLSVMRRLSKSWKRYTALRYRYFTPGLELQPIPENVAQFLRDRRNTLLSEENENKENIGEDDTTMVDGQVPESVKSSNKGKEDDDQTKNQTEQSKKPKNRAGAKIAKNEIKKAPSKITKVSMKRMKKKIASTEH